MRAFAIFDGGPLDGTKRELEHADSVYHVPLQPDIRHDDPVDIDEPPRINIASYIRSERVEPRQTPTFIYRYLTPGSHQPGDRA